MEIRLDSNGLIDLAWCEAMQRNGLLNFGRGQFALPDERLDSTERADSSVPLARDLNFVLQFVRDQYRPTKWAQVLQPVAVPDWASNWEISKIVGTGRIKPASEHGPHDIVRGDISRSTTTGKMLEYINGYYYSFREMTKWAKLGVNAETERAMSQAMAADQFMDQLCATGSPFSDSLTKGLANQTPSTDVPAVLLGTAKSTTTSWTLATSADFALVLDDLHALISAVYANSKELRQADTIVMPLDEFNALNRLRAANFSASVLETWMVEWARRIGKPGRIQVWDRFSNQGTVSSGPRVCAFDSTDVNVACVMMGKPYGVDQVLEITRGLEANASLVTGGVRVLDGTGIQYLDLNA